MHIRNNDEVQPGQPLFDIDPQPYEIALQSARAPTYAIGAQLGQAARWPASRRRAALAGGAEANRDMAERDASRLEKLYEEDPGAISVRRLEIAQATRDEARSKVRRAEADLRKAQEAAGEAGDDNAQMRSAVGGGREGRTRPGAHARRSRRRAAWSPTCAPTSATSRSPARR